MIDNLREWVAAQLDRLSSRIQVTAPDDDVDYSCAAHPQFLLRDCPFPHDVWEY